MSTIYDVAREAGVSITTVSLVLNDKGAVRQETRERVKKAAAELSYKPNHAAKTLRQNPPFDNRDCLGVILPFNVSDVSREKWSYQAICGIEKVLHGAGKHLLLGWVRKNGSEYSFPKMLHEKQIDRFILLSSAAYSGIDELMKKLKVFGLPAVVIGHPGEQFGFSSVLLDFQQAAYTACLHLIEDDRRSIAAITGPLDYFSAKERFDGYVLALIGKNRPIINELIYEGDFSEESGYEGMKKIIDRAGFPLGVFAANDAMAKGAMKYLSDNKISVPEEAGVIGFDNIPEIVESTQPRLSSVNARWDEIGEEAAHQALFLKNKGSPRNIIMRCELVLRESTMLKGGPEHPAGESLRTWKSQRTI